MKYIWQKKDWPHFHWKNQELLNLLGKARQAQGQLMSLLDSLGFDFGQSAQMSTLVEDTIKTAEIEGEVLQPESVRSSVAKQLGLPMTGLPPTERPIDGLVKVLLDATQNYQQVLTAKRLKTWQATLFPTGYSGMQKIIIGAWRIQDPMQVVSGALGREKVHYEAPPASRLSGEMKIFLKWWQETLRSSMDGIVRAALAHLYFVTIHPFADGNGRVARALTDMALAQDEKTTIRYYSLSSQIMMERDAYYRVLEKTQKGSLDVTEWLLWFICCLHDALVRSGERIKITLGKTFFWQKQAHLLINERQKKILNRLLDAGPDGFVGGMNTRKYVSLTQVSRATAYRELNDLLHKKLLRLREGSGRSTSYDVDWSCFREKK